MNTEEREQEFELLQLQVQALEETVERMADFINALSADRVAHKMALVSFAGLAASTSGTALQKWQRSFQELCAAQMAAAAMSEEGLQTASGLRRAFVELSGLLFQSKSEG